MPVPVRIFIVEDDQVYSAMLNHYLSLNPDHEVHKFSDALSCMNAVAKLRPHIVTVDYRLPGITGGELLKKIKDFDTNIHVIIVSGQEDVKTATALLREGAADYIVKDDETRDRILHTVTIIREKLRLQKQIQQLSSALGSKYEVASVLIGQSSEMKAVHQNIEKAAKTNITVSISGETGTGKELAARAIHYNSNRKNNPFIAVNLAAIPSELLESELFGYEKGAFTGAANLKIGRFEEANGGTLFLDEIGEMELALQAKLLRVLQEREVVRLGGNKTIKLDFRLVLGTNRNLRQEVSNGKFREDLYYRLYGFPIEMPPLRHRDEDILLLAKHFLNEFCKENNLSVPKIDQSAKEKLFHYSWPGNVRQLKAIIDYAAVMCNNNVIVGTDITFEPVGNSESILKHEMTLDEYNKEIIRAFLKRYHNNVLLVAKKLKIGKSTIYNMLQRREV
jgi:two-component system, NtrC family, response regulator AtoC